MNADAMLADLLRAVERLDRLAMDHAKTAQTVHDQIRMTGQPVDLGELYHTGARMISSQATVVHAKATALQALRTAASTGWPIHDRRAPPKPIPLPSDDTEGGTHD